MDRELKRAFAKLVTKEDLERFTTANKKDIERFATATKKDLERLAKAEDLVNVELKIDELIEEVNKLAALKKLEEKVERMRDFIRATHAGAEV